MKQGNGLTRVESCLLWQLFSCHSLGWEFCSLNSIWQHPTENYTLALSGRVLNLPRCPWINRTLLVGTAGVWTQQNSLNEMAVSVPVSLESSLQDPRGPHWPWLDRKGTALVAGRSPVSQWLSLCIWSGQGKMKQASTAVWGELDESQGGVLDRKYENSARVHHLLRGGMTVVHTPFLFGPTLDEQQQKIMCKATKKANGNKPSVCHGVRLGVERERDEAGAHHHVCSGTWQRAEFLPCCPGAVCFSGCPTVTGSAPFEGEPRALATLGDLRDCWKSWRQRPIPLCALCSFQK